MEIHDRIKMIRKEIGLTQSEFGSRLGISRDVFANLENNRLAKPETKEPLLRLICKEFDVDENWLRTGEGSMMKYEDLSQQEKIMKYASSLLKGDDSIISDAIKAFILTYAELDQQDRDLLEEIGQKYLENFKRSE